MPQTAFALFNYGDVPGAIDVNSTGITVNYLVLYRNTSPVLAQMRQGVLASFASDATPAQMNAAITAAIVNGGTPLGFTVPSSNVFFPAFQRGA